MEPSFLRLDDEPPLPPLPLEVVLFGPLFFFFSLLPEPPPLLLLLSLPFPSPPLLLALLLSEELTLLCGVVLELHEPTIFFFFFFGFLFGLESKTKVTLFFCNSSPPLLSLSVSSSLSSSLCL